MIQLIRLAACSLLAMLSTGCTIWSDRLGTSYINRADTGASFIRPSVLVPRATTNWNADKGTFVGLAISGGGSRAANFGMAVLGELNTQGILPHVDAISAVSGGSIPTAWFAINGTDSDWFERGKKVVAHNFLGSFLVKLANPSNLVMTSFTDRDRTDLLAEVFREQITGGKNFLFGQLGARGPMRPAVYFNATDTTNEGSRFVFSDDQFLRQIGSRLDEFPISMAMATSGAFPGVFNSVTLRKFSLDPSIRSQEEGLASTRQYVHLIDGGSADNFGVDTLIDLARQHFVKRQNRRQAHEGCLIIVADSHVPNRSISESTQSDRRNFLSTLIDLNFLDAIDALLSNRRNDALHAMGILRDQGLSRFDLKMNDDVIEYNVTPYRRVSQFPILYYEQDGKAIDGPQFAPQVQGQSSDEKEETGETQSAQPKTFMCTAWHVGLDDIHRVIPSKSVAPIIHGSAQPVEQTQSATANRVPLIALRLDNPQDQEVFAFRVKLARLVKQIPTNYKLEGPKNCSPEFVQQAIYDVAKIAIRQDRASVRAICDWFVKAGLNTAGQCRVDPEPLHRNPYPIVSLEKPRNLTANEQALRRFVQCQPH